MTLRHSLRHAASSPTSSYKLLASSLRDPSSLHPSGLVRPQELTAGSVVGPNEEVVPESGHEDSTFAGGDRQDEIARVVLPKERSGARVEGPDVLAPGDEDGPSLYRDGAGDPSDFPRERPRPRLVAAEQRRPGRVGSGDEESVALKGQRAAHAARGPDERSGPGVVNPHDGEGVAPAGD